MSHKGHTKDEKVILALYELANDQGSVDAEVSRELVMRRVSIQARGMEAICNLLAQANFIKKIGKDFLRLTPQGERLALELLQE